MDSQTAGMPAAISVLTAWLEAAPGVPSDELMWQLIQTIVQGGPEAEVELTIGLVKVASVLLVKLEGSSGQNAQQILQTMAIRYTQ